MSDFISNMSSTIQANNMHKAKSAAMKNERAPDLGSQSLASKAREMENRAAVSEVRANNGSLHSARAGIAASALDQTGEAMGRLQEITTRATDSSLSSADREALQVEANQLQQEINDVMGNTKFNGQSVFSGGSVTAKTGDDFTYQDADGSSITGAIGTIDLSSADAASSSLTNIQGAQENLTKAKVHVNTAAAGVYRSQKRSLKEADIMANMAHGLDLSQQMKNTESLHKFSNQQKIQSMLLKTDVE